MALGVSFFPQPQVPNQQQPQAGQPVQQALQMLSLRVPRFGSQGAILPQPLQQRQPGAPIGPVPGTPEWEELMRRLMGGQPGGAPAAPGAPTGAPPPNFAYPAGPKPPTYEPIGPKPDYPATPLPPPDQAPPGKWWPGPGGLTKTFDPYPDQKQY